MAPVRGLIPVATAVVEEPIEEALADRHTALLLLDEKRYWQRCAKIEPSEDEPGQQQSNEEQERAPWHWPAVCQQVIQAHNHSREHCIGSCECGDGQEQCSDR